MDETDILDDEWRAGFYVTDKELTVEYGADAENPRAMALEFRTDGERALVEQVLADPNFWVQIVNALSASLKRTVG